MRSVVRICLGLGLLLHGLGNAVLPLRALDATGPGTWLPALTLVWVVAIVGFAAAGLSVLGVRPLTRLALAASLVAGGCGLFGYAKLGDLDLWPGGLLSLTLPIVTAMWVRTKTDAPITASHRWTRRGTDVLGPVAVAPQLG